MTCKESVEEDKEFRWLVDYLAEQERAGNKKLSPKAIPYHDVIPDTKVCESYLRMLDTEGFVEVHTTGRSGTQEIDSIRINAKIHALARKAKEYEKEAEDSDQR